MLVFLCSAFHRIYLVSTFSLAFMLNSFSPLTTVENIAITQNVQHNLRARTTQRKKGALIYQNSSSNLFCLLGQAKRPQRQTRRIFLVFFNSLKASFTLSLRSRTGIKSCLRVSDHCLTSSKLFYAFNMTSFTRFAESSSALFMSHTYILAPPFLQRLVFQQFLRRSSLPFLVPSCNFLEQAPPCFTVSRSFLSLHTFDICVHKVRLTSSPARVATFGVGKEIQCTPNPRKSQQV